MAKAQQAAEPIYLRCPPVLVPEEFGQSAWEFGPLTDGFRV